VIYGGYTWFAGSAWTMAQSFYPAYGYPQGDWLCLDSNWGEGRQTYLPQDELDASVPVVALFHKLVPKDWDLFDYDQPVWMRFARRQRYGDPRRVPPHAWLRDALDDANEQQLPALSLLPLQQLLGNFLTQHFLQLSEPHPLGLAEHRWVDSDH
jgi:hypothetical protein